MLVKVIVKVTMLYIYLLNETFTTELDAALFNQSTEVLTGFDFINYHLF